MSEQKNTFKQAVITSVIVGIFGAVPAIISAWHADQSNAKSQQALAEAERIQQNAIIRQARLDERDKLNYEFAIENHIKSAFLLPVEDNGAWRKYLACKDMGKSRIDCAKEQENILLGNVEAAVGKEIE